ncbi:MAG: TetR/AcrR family transcriptional regulator C-terminal ligand-binding domain-containing protein [Pantoea sp.]|uniref:TetR/AcrR family transcriptional regulator n=1 Tax=Pantoea TaxID=53335 RepID=UPI0028A25B2D|nr:MULTISPECIES: TetR/AcrR family transcriptional regulator C-terminal ligand-binding domain-containing protein [Pantoea]MDU5780696.1 TetR/AcrR family transcriptional regulator C-terminal ligand-binding domain-containing protein [Pantoea sp.]
MAREMIRQGGRSARIQEEVHKAVNTLLKTRDRSELTVPMVAETAGVTPSTLYRRWGDLTQLLADVAVARMRPISEPEDTGSMQRDVEAFILQYAEEMSSKPGRQMLADVIGSGSATVKCCGFTRLHLETLHNRAIARGEAGFSVDEALDTVVAPVIYHILFEDREPTPDYCRERVARLFLNR